MYKVRTKIEFTQLYTLFYVGEMKFENVCNFSNFIILVFPIYIVIVRYLTIAFH